MQKAKKRKKRYDDWTSKTIRRTGRTGHSDDWTSKRVEGQSPSNGVEKTENPIRFRKIPNPCAALIISYQKKLACFSFNFGWVSEGLEGKEKLKNKHVYLKCFSNVNQSLVVRWPHWSSPIGDRWIGRRVMSLWRGFQLPVWSLNFSVIVDSAR